MRILHSVLNSAALSANSSPSHKPSPSPEKIVQVGAAEGASSSASVSPEPLGRSAALRQTDFPSLMQVRPRTQRTPVGGDRQRLDRPPHRRGSSLRLWGGKPKKSRCGGGDGRRWADRTVNNMTDYSPLYGSSRHWSDYQWNHLSNNVFKHFLQNYFTS